ncbi:hypothetical protein HFP57_07620 [Parasphingopyxis algicola]|uniref:hypothetical protein n=1 Tax=Parasphingopyxis algicola TaxID=2026624 RepID=UPI0015A02459|nr:hypothetical protein [Parasphingopyxis algicola]QLC24910.1 hypothetical protein HFP57_07620 [Parasphingopyxis algicola]
MDEAEAACVNGLAQSPLRQASADDHFYRHYQCGLLIWPALDEELHRQGGLHGLNRAFLARVRAGAPWNEITFFDVAHRQGASNTLLQKIMRLNGGGYSDPAAEIAKLSALATQRVRHSAR